MDTAAPQGFQDTLATVDQVESVDIAGIPELLVYLDTQDIRVPLESVGIVDIQALEPQDIVVTVESELQVIVDILDIVALELPDIVDIQVQAESPDTLDTVGQAGSADIQDTPAPVV